MGFCGGRTGKRTVLPQTLKRRRPRGAPAVAARAQHRASSTAPTAAPGERGGDGAEARARAAGRLKRPGEPFPGRPRARTSPCRTCIPEQVPQSQAGRVLARDTGHVRRVLPGKRLSCTRDSNLTCTEKKTGSTWPLCSMFIEAEIYLAPFMSPSSLDTA